LGDYFDAFPLSIFPNGRLALSSFASFSAAARALAFNPRDGANEDFRS